MECPKPQCYNCKLRINYKLCIKGIKFNFCKTAKVNTDIVKYTKSWKCDGCITRKAQYTYVSKKQYVKCTKPKRKYGDYEDLPPKYDSDCKFNIFLTKLNN